SSSTSRQIFHPANNGKQPPLGASPQTGRRTITPDVDRREQRIQLSDSEPVQGEPKGTVGKLPRQLPRHTFEVHLQDDDVSKSAAPSTRVVRGWWYSSRVRRGLEYDEGGGDVGNDNTAKRWFQMVRFCGKRTGDARRLFRLDPGGGTHGRELQELIKSGNMCGWYQFFEGGR
ncbi:unnamed protein product, partial [Sphacelaria rigidula]